MRLEGKTAIITGAASGIGEAAAHRFADEGAAVLAVDINGEAGEEVARGSGGRISFSRADVSSPDDVARVTAEALDRWGHVDILVNNAGASLGGHKLAFDSTDDDFDRMVAINLKSVFLFSRAVGPHMVAAGAGSIVNTASSSGIFAGNQVSVYGAAKGGVVSFTKNLAIELAKTGVRVNAVCPHATLTPVSERRMASLPDPAAARERMDNMNPIGRVGYPIEIAHAILFLASDEASFITGAILPVDGGASARGGDRF